MIVPWYEVRNYMHVDSGWREGTPFAAQTAQSGASRAGAAFVEADYPAGDLSSSEEERSFDEYTDDDPAGYAGAESRRAAFKVAEGRTDTRSFKQQERDILAAEDELKAIFERTYGPVKSRVGQSESYKPSRTVAAEIPEKYRKPKPKPQKEYLLVDGYNMIFAWEHLRALAQRDIKAARDALLDDLSNYAGYTKANVICVFDAYKVAGGTEQVYRYHNIDVIFTKEAETADLYIEKAAHELTKQYSVKVATSDAVEQVIIYGAGAVRLSAMNFYEEVRSAERERKATYVADDTDVRRRVGSSLKDELEKTLAGTDLPEETN
jgi:predicted RNA-binding protein with PIN domain